MKLLVGVSSVSSVWPEPETRGEARAGRHCRSSSRARLQFSLLQSSTLCCTNLERSASGYLVLQEPQVR